MDVGPGSAHDRASAGEDAEDLLVFVDRLAAAAQDERVTAQAREQIGRIIREGTSPPGLRRLAEALAASAADVPPAPRHPVDDPSSVVPAMRGSALVVLDEAAPAAVSAAVSALVADGRRVVVTAETDAELDAVRLGMTTGRTVDALPDVPHAELRELRRLLATSTAAARARAGQDLPAADAMPALDEVRVLCALADRASRPDDAVVPTLLSRVEPDRRDAVTSIARCVAARLDALGSRQQYPWEWELLGHLIHTRHRGAFDRTLEDVAQATAIARARRDAAPVTFLGPLSGDAVDLLCSYYEFLESGGRTRAYFRPSVQRDVQPVLRRIRIADREPVTAADVLLVLDHLELTERMGRIVAGCVEMGVPAPRGPADLAPLAERLGLVAAAARSVGSLRHDVLFLATDSPLSVPDVDSAARVSAAILDYAEHGSAAEAGQRLDRLADQLADRAAVTVTAPEHARAVTALRARDAQAYESALDALGAARRELRDEARRTTLLGRLRAASPALAAAWDELHERDSGAYGLACFSRSDTLLRALPPPDSADVVVVLGAAQLGVERLLLTAVAPRMIAVVAPDEQPEGSPTLLSVLQRAAALVIRGRTTGGSGRVVQLNPGARSAGTVSAVGQAGA